MNTQHTRPLHSEGAHDGNTLPWRDSPAPQEGYRVGVAPVAPENRATETMVVREKRSLRRRGREVLRSIGAALAPPKTEAPTPEPNKRAETAPAAAELYAEGLDPDAFMDKSDTLLERFGRISIDTRKTAMLMSPEQFADRFDTKGLPEGTGLRAMVEVLPRMADGRSYGEPASVLYLLESPDSLIFTTGRNLDLAKESQKMWETSKASLGSALKRNRLSYPERRIRRRHRSRPTP